MPSSSFFSGTNPTPTEYENAVDLVAQASAQATAALASQTAAATSAQSAQGYSVSAGTSAETATQQAAAAATSAAGALASQNAAATSATAASSSATSASSSASNAATSATNASNSATSASGSATSAGTYATNAANSATAAANSASDAAATLANALTKSDNLASLSNKSTSRSNLGVAIGSDVQAWDADLDAIAAISSTSGLLKKTAANTWSLDTTSYHSGTLGLSQGGTGATDAAGARTSLGLGTAATAAATSFAQVANNLSDLVSASTARSNLGLGSVATLASTAVLQSANNLSDLGNVTTARSSLGLGSLATLSSINNSNWSGTQLSVANGGTGLTSLTAGYIPYGNGTGAFNSSSGLTYDGSNFAVSSAVSSIYIQPSTTINNALLRCINAGGTAYVGMDNSTGGLTTAYALNLFHSGAYPITMSTNGTERMRIASDGSVGIGTTSPSAKLHLYGGVLRVTQDNTVLLESFATTNTAYVGTSSSHPLVLRTGNTDRATIDVSGNLGLGVTPSAKFDVQTAANKRIQFADASHSSLTGLASGILFSRGSDTANLAAIFGWNTGGLAITGREGITFATGGPALYSDTVRAMTLDASGNLGVGTTSIAARLHVSGSNATNVAFNGSTRGIRFDFDGTQSNIIGVDNTFFGSYQPLFVSGSYLALGTGLTERARINSSGNFGIGTTNPVLKFVVSNGGAEGFEIEPTAIASAPAFVTYNRSTGSYIQSSFRANKYAWLNSSGSQTMTLEDSGNLLVGTTSTWSPAGGTSAKAFFATGLSIGTSSQSACYNDTRIAFNSTNYYVLNNSSTGVNLASGSTSWAAQSDIRLKDVIGTFTNALSDISQIEAFRFTFKNDVSKTPRVGVSAQSAQKVVPEAISISEDGYLWVRYPELTPLMIAAIQELSAKVTALEAANG